MRIAVAPGLRGQGLSRRLMDRMVSSAREKGARDLTLEVRSGNETAINLYKAYGFKREAVRRDIIGIRKRTPGSCGSVPCQELPLKFRIFPL